MHVFFNETWRSYAHGISNVIQMMGKVEAMIVQSLTFKT